ncbi:MAG: TRAM domain-containing protein, partial [Tenericutes bacterium]|nr:TRAM domain-containing protein [Mycoplasmatota bacterium]
RRKGTPAATYESDITEAEAKDRLHRLNVLVNEGYESGNKRFENKIVKVLVEGYSKNNKSVLTGRTENNKLVNFPGNATLIGKIVEVEITNAKTWSLDGKVDSNQ